ncbi:porin family protein [Dyella terrae]|uniref:porin family protein n=1 Tax=Dyella terrae TaxID=522259 RepID=UPI001EFD3EE2|nr:porin family protein [Dyella terrae]ULU24842.1 porin family protein [Dyella terrae]
MKKLISIVALSAALVSPLTAALAADQNDGGFFVRGNAGQSDYRINSNYFSNNNDFGWGLGAGYRWATSSGNWGVDGGYVDLGQSNPNKNFLSDQFGLNAKITGKVASHGWSLGGNYIYEFNDNWNVQARTGILFSTSRLNLNVYGPLGSLSERESSSNTSWYGGVGMGYDFTRNISMNLSYDYYRIGFDGGHGHASLLSLGAEYRF